jgi:hypothetical protein
MSQTKETFVLGIDNIHHGAHATTFRLSNRFSSKIVKQYGIGNIVDIDL